MESVITCCAYTQQASGGLLQRTAIRIIDPLKCSVMSAERKKKKLNLDFLLVHQLFKGIPIAVISINFYYCNVFQEGWRFWG